MRTLSKSKIIAYRQCQKRMWLEIHKPDLRDDSASEMVFAIGNQVGEVARQVFDPHGNGAFIDIKVLGHLQPYPRHLPLLHAALRRPVAGGVTAPVNRGMHGQ